jgi:Putative prokaryotic signal transducing protein
MQETLATLTTVPSEFEAQLLVNVLEEHGITASTSGQYTAQFRAEVPGAVKVLVRSEDLEAAEEVVREAREHSEAPSETEPWLHRSRILRVGFITWLLLGLAATFGVYLVEGFHPMMIVFDVIFAALLAIISWRR